MSNEAIMRILCEIYAKQEGLQIDAIFKPNEAGNRENRKE